MKQRVVVTGIGCVSPNGIGREAFWEACKEGRSGVRRILSFPTDNQPVQIAGSIPEFREEDYVAPKDRAHVSRTVPLALAAVQEALEHSGLEPSKLSIQELRQIGVLMGSGGAAQEFSEEQYRMYYEGREKQCSVYVIPSSTPGTLSSEISMRHGFRGMSHLVSTGCTSSLDAIGYAMRHIERGDLRIAIAGGSDAPLAPLILRGFQLMRIMSTRWNHAPERGSRPFSADRDGFVIAEGAWFFVLEQRDAAIARGANILGEITGYGSTCEAFHRVRLDEGGEEPARAIQMALGDAGLPPEAIQYVNYHGTSTELNDRIETKAMRLAFGTHAERMAGSATKSLIGHPQGACGSAGLAATILAMRDGVAHPTINLEKPDPQCDLDYIPLKARAMAIENAVVNCIAFGSKNSALVVTRPS